MNNGFRSWDLWLAFAGLVGVCLLAGFSLTRSYRTEMTAFEQKVAASLQFFREIVDPGDPFHDLLDAAAQSPLSPQGQRQLQAQFRTNVSAAFNPFTAQRETMVAGIYSATAQRWLVGEVPSQGAPVFSKDLDRNCCRLQLRIAFPGVTWWTPLSAMIGEMLLTLVTVLGFLGSILFLRRALLKQRQLNHWHRDFANQMLHSLNTPLATMRLGLASLTAEDSASDSTILGPMTRAQNRMQAVLDRFLASISSDRKHGTAQRTQVDLAELLRQQLADFALLARENESTMSLNFPEGSWIAAANAFDLQQIIALVLENALVHGGRGVQIRIGMEKEDHRIHILVEDNGPGIAKSHQSLVFQPFYRVDDGKKQGMGLGLYVARNLARSNHGDLKLLPAKGSGCTLMLVVAAAGGEDL